MADVKDEGVKPKLFASFYIQVVNQNHPQASGVGIHGFTADPTPSKKGYGIKRIIATEAGYIDLAEQQAERREIQLGLRTEIRAAVRDVAMAAAAKAVGVEPAVFKATLEAESGPFQEKAGDPPQPCLENMYDMRIPYKGPHNEARLVVDAVDRVLHLMMTLEEKPASICIVLPTLAYSRLFGKNLDKVIKAEFKDKEGNVLPYVEELRRVILKLTMCAEDDDIVVRFHHDNPEGSFGREHAYLNAQDGMTAAIKDSSEWGDCDVVPAQGYWSYKSERSPWLNKARMLCVTPEDLSIDLLKERFFYLIDHESNKQDKESSIGQTLPHISMSVVKLKDPDGVMDNVILEQATRTPRGEQRLFLMMMDNLYRPSTHQQLYRHGADYLRVPGITIDLTDSREVEVTHELYPPRQAFRALSKMDDLEGLLKHAASTLDLEGMLPRSSFRSKKYGWIEMTRITDRFFTTTTNEKGKEVYGITKDVDMPNTTVDVQGYYPADPERGYGSQDTLKFALTIGMDTPKRNALAALAGEGIQAYLLTSMETDISIAYHVVIVKGEEMGIWTTPYANRVFMDSTK